MKKKTAVAKRVLESESYKKWHGKERCIRIQIIDLSGNAFDDGRKGHANQPDSVEMEELIRAGRVRKTTRAECDEFWNLLQGGNSCHE